MDFKPVFRPKSERSTLRQAQDFVVKQETTLAREKFFQKSKQTNERKRSRSPRDRKITQAELIPHILDDIAEPPVLLFGKGQLGGFTKDTTTNLEERTWKTKPACEMTAREWVLYREELGISVSSGAPNPMKQWEDAQLGPNVYESLRRARYRDPSPIQAAAIPAMIQSHDIIATAPTGSGKSAAFLIPLIHRLQSIPRITYETAENGPYALILLPTRELATQIATEASRLANDLRVFTIIGGKAVNDQSFELRHGVEIVVGTPGRVLDWLRQQYLVLNQLKVMVADEADKMFLLNLQDDLISILDMVKIRKVQYALFSATMQPDILRIWKQYLPNPCIIEVQNESACNIQQEFKFETESSKKSTLAHFLKSRNFPMIIFVNKKSTADSLYLFVKQNSSNVCLIHGGRSQSQRHEAMTTFRNSKGVLVATDVAARGVDVPGVRWVINFDCPNTIVEYVHRIGRTGRMGRNGRAITLLLESDSAMFPHLKTHLELYKLPIPEPLKNSTVTEDFYL